MLREDEGRRPKYSSRYKRSGLNITVGGKRKDINSSARLLRVDFYGTAGKALAESLKSTTELGQALDLQHQKPSRVVNV